MPMTAVIFDAFGTLLQISKGTHPYRRILRAGIEQGRRPRASDAESLLTIPMDLRQAADFFEIIISSTLMAQLESDLCEEIASIEAFDDGLAAVAALKASGLKVAVCSNLAKPYALAIERFYPNLDGYSFSFSVGAVKPSNKIYQHATELISAPPCETWMIGDSKRCDCDGPTQFGMRGVHLEREGRGDYRSLHRFAMDALRER